MKGLIQGRKGVIKLIMNNYPAETESLIIINVSEDHFSPISSMLGLQTSNNVTARSVCGFIILCIIKPILGIKKK